MLVFYYWWTDMWATFYYCCWCRWNSAFMQIRSVFKRSKMSQGRLKRIMSCKVKTTVCIYTVYIRTRIVLGYIQHNAASLNSPAVNTGIRICSGAFDHTTWSSSDEEMIMMFKLPSFPSLYGRLVGELHLVLRKIIWYDWKLLNSY